jgi:hypothetical protein
MKAPMETQSTQESGMTTPQITIEPALLFDPERIVWPANWAGHVPFAAWLVAHQRPSTLVELGTHNGFSYSAFCQAVQQEQLATRCYAIDTWEGDDHSGYYGEHIYQDIKAWHDARFAAFSQLRRTTFDQAVTEFTDSSIDLLHIDGLHTYEAVKHDFDTWLPKLSSRAIVLFHDTDVRQGDFGVWRFWEEITAHYPHLQFTHCNGLGVLLVGAEQPPALTALHAQFQQDPATLQRLFAQLGERIELSAYSRETERQRVEAVQQRDELEHQRNSLHQQLQQLQQQQQQHQDALELATQKAESQRQEIDAQNARMEALLHSNSWRLTSPLRQLAKWVR